MTDLSAIRARAEAATDPVECVRVLRNWSNDVPDIRARDPKKVAREVLAEVGALVAERERLREALERYGSHHVNCGFWDTDNPRDCSCGFSAALEAPRG